jgi:hypothetical protein
LSEAAGEPSAARARAGDTRAAPRRADGRLAAGVFATLVAACFAALIVTQRLKHTPTPVEGFRRTPRFAPGAPGAAGEERISFKLTKADRVTVTVESVSGEQVATLVSGVAVGRYRILSLRWNGRRGAARSYAVLRRADGYTTLVPRNRGAVAPPGEYKIRVALLRQKRSIPSPQTFELVRR